MKPRSDKGGGKKTGDDSFHDTSSDNVIKSAQSVDPAGKNSGSAGAASMTTLYLFTSLIVVGLVSPSLLILKSRKETEQ